jgi:probable HAF family extracellular repeat protein
MKTEAIMSLCSSAQALKPVTSSPKSASRGLKTAAVAALLVATSVSGFARDRRSAKDDSSRAQASASDCAPFPAQSSICRMLSAARASHPSAHNGASSTENVAHEPEKSKSYQFASADFPGADASFVLARNATTAVGLFESDVIDGAYILKGGVYDLFEVPFTAVTLAFGINSAGDIAGGYLDSAGNEHGFLYMASTGTFTTLDVPGGVSTEAHGINNSDEIVGQYTDAAGAQHGFLYATGVYVTIDYPGATFTSASGINSSGDIVGAWGAGQSYNNGFLLHTGLFTDVVFPGAIGTTNWGINDKGQIAGGFTDTNGNLHGFIYAYKLGTWTQIDIPLAPQTSLTQIENNGSIAGYYYDNNGEGHGFTAH